MTARLCTLPNGRSLYCLSEAEGATLYREIFSARCWLDRGLRLRDGDVVVDVGANVGMAALFFHLERRDVRLLCFEPAPGPFDALARNVELHGMDATCRRVALGAEGGDRELTYYPDVTTMSGLRADPAADADVTRAYLRNSGFDEDDVWSFVPGPHTATTVPCRVETLSAEIRAAGLPRVDLLKVDVEKSEADVLAGIDTATWSLIGQVAVEVHDERGALAAVLGQLDAAGFDTQVRQDPLLAGTAIYDVAATRPEREPA
ncbi:FkbM family methyltransferase [Amycolatopsis sp. cmx-4-54]|uniref:FkbM family methyltransferase n=1 Tax=Amycolatopsis sp. cmx-4-54 TaxID=2790936 RepID=UPI00397A2143